MDNNNLFNNNENVTTDQTTQSNAAPQSEPVNTTAETAAEASYPATPANHTVETPYQPEQPSAQPAAEQAAAGQPTEQPSNSFSRYQDTTSRYASIPRETVYINNNADSSVNGGKKKKEKAPKGRLGMGAVAALVAVCMVFSGGAAFAGTYIANRVNGTTATVSGGSSAQSGAPSVIFQSYNNQNKTAGTYEQVSEAVTPTVVEIVTESVVTSSLWGGSYVTSGAGSGVIISADGLIITNNHVVSGAENIIVTTKDGAEYEAELIGTDSDSDIAVIKVDATNLPFALIGNSDEISVGQEVIAVGNPLGEFGGSVTNGIISALSREITIDGVTMTLLQTNAAVNPGNSGGGLFNMYGELIGIVNAKSSTTSSGTAVEGIGFAIPVNEATKVASELINYGYVRGKVALGISIIDIEDSWTAMQYRVNALGVYIVSSEYTNELKSGDRITAIDGTEVTYSSDVKALLKKYEVGDEVTVTVVRNGQYVDVKVTLQEYVPATTDESAFEKNVDKGIQG